MCKRQITIFIFIFISFFNANAQKKNNDSKIVSYLKEAHTNLKTYSETGSYVSKSRTNYEKSVILETGKHTLFFDNTTQKLRIDGEVIDNEYPQFSRKIHYICIAEDKKDNIFSPSARDTMTSKQEEIMTTINRHNTAFFLSNPKFGIFKKSIFEDTISLKVEIEKLNKVKCYKLSRKYLLQMHPKVEESEEHAKHLFDSVGLGQEYAQVPKRINNFNEVKELYWFRKSDGMLIKKTEHHTVYLTEGNTFYYDDEYFYDPKYNTVLPANIFEK